MATIVMSNDPTLLASGGTDPGLLRSAWLASRKGELLAPAAALLDLCEMVLKDARELEHPAFLADQEQALASAQRLVALAEAGLDPASPGATAPDFARRLRHDLRSPLAHILGLCEFWLEEDAEELVAERFRDDLARMHALGGQMLAGLEALVEFRKTTSDPDIGPGGAGPPPEIRGVVRELRPPAQGEPAARGEVLVVDDNEVNRDLLRRRLRRDGHAVTMAADGGEALAAVASRPFDLILLDIIMPGLNGLEVLLRLKADERWRNIPVIMISALGDIDSVVRCIELGAEDYLPRPFKATLLRARIGACLEKKRLRDQLEQERRRADELLHVILPAPVVAELKETDTVVPRRHEDVAVLFADIVGFTSFCDRNPPEQVVPHLQQLVEQWEWSAVRHGVEKIKTIGDAFMAAAGLLQPVADPVAACVRCGLEMIAACRALPVGWDVRVGVHVGPVVAGKIGARQYLYDLWGDTVNLAARMESNGEPGAVTLSAAAWRRIAGRARGQPRGPVPVKGYREPVPVYRFEEFTG